MNILNYMIRINNLIKRIKIAFSLRQELLQFVSELDSRYETTNEWCKKKEWRVFDNVHKTLNIIEEEKNKEITNNTLSEQESKWYNDRAVDITLKTFIVVNK